jgi:hypothetical protein
MYKELLDKIKKMEVIEKGSRQRKMPFNPKEVTEETRKPIEKWIWDANQDDRNDIPRQEGNVRERALNKLHGLTDSKKHPETGERMFLMHRGMSHEEHDELSGSDYNKQYKSSWSPKLDSATEQANNNDGLVLSSWIPESQIHSSLAAYGESDSSRAKWDDEGSMTQEEQEVIVAPHQLNVHDSVPTPFEDDSHKNRFETREALQSSQIAPQEKQQQLKQTFSRQSARKKMESMASSEKMISGIAKQMVLDSTQEIEMFTSAEAVELIRDRIRKSVADLDFEITDSEIEEQLEKNIKRAFKTGLSLIGLIHGAQYMGDFPQDSAPEPQAIERSTESPTELREPADYPMAPEQPQSSGKEDFLQAIRLTESSGGTNTNHATMKRGIHAGTAAIGDYGLMPNTVNEMAVRMGRKHPLNSYAKMDQNEIRDSFKKNPDHEKQMADFMADHVNKRFGGDERKMAYAWFQGHNLTNNHFKNDEKHKNYLDHDYVKKYDKHIQQVRQSDPEGS